MTVDAEFTETPTAALAVREEVPLATASLFGTDNPVEVVTRAVAVADALKSVVVAKKLVKNISGKEYPLLEAWQTLGAMLRVTTICEWTRKTENGWEARVVVRDANGNVIAAAENECNRRESRWKSADDYAIRSMAQSRTTGKALRSVLGFIFVLAGYEATPADEMPTDEAKRADREPEPKPVERVSNDAIKALWDAAGKPGGTRVSEWLATTFPGFVAAGKTLTPEQSVEAASKLRALAGAPAATSEKMASPAQRTKILLLMKEQGIVVDDDRHDYLELLVGVRSTKDLTMAQAKAAIDKLTLDTPDTGEGE